MKKIEFQYSLTKKNHFISLVKGQLKTIGVFLLIFTFCFFAINLEFFVYNFPYNTPVVLITYAVYLVIIFLIMLLISLLYSFVMTRLFDKNNAYRIYMYKLDKNKLVEKDSNFSLNLDDVLKIKIKKNYIKIISLKIKQVIVFEKQNFVNKNDYESIQEFLKKE